MILQPRRQRRQVHRPRARSCSRSSLDTSGGRRPRAHVLRQRHRHRHRRKTSSGDIFGAIHAGRRVHHAALRRHRPRPGDLRAARRADGRTHLGRERAGQRQPLPLRRAFRPAGDRCRGAGDPAREPARPARARRGRQRDESPDSVGGAHQLGDAGGDRGGDRPRAVDDAGGIGTRRAVRPGADRRADARDRRVRAGREHRRGRAPRENKGDSSSLRPGPGTRRQGPSGFTAS